MAPKQKSVDDLVKMLAGMKGPVPEEDSKATKNAVKRKAKDGDDCKQKPEPGAKKGKKKAEEEVPAETDAGSEPCGVQEDIDDEDVLPPKKKSADKTRCGGKRKDEDKMINHGDVNVTGGSSKKHKTAMEVPAADVAIVKAATGDVPTGTVSRHDEPKCKGDATGDGLVVGKALRTWRPRRPDFQAPDDEEQEADLGGVTASQVLIGMFYVYMRGCFLRVFFCCENIFCFHVSVQDDKLNNTYVAVQMFCWGCFSCVTRLTQCPICLRLHRLPKFLKRLFPPVLEV